MRLGDTAYLVVLIGAIAVAVLALALAILLGRRRFGRVAIGSAAVVALAGAVVAGGLLLRVHSLIVVRDSAHGRELVRQRLVGDPGRAFVLALDANLKDGSYPSGAVWVVNESVGSVRVEPILYGAGFGSKPIEIPSDTAAPFPGIDHLGPDQAPPKEITVTTKPFEFAANQTKYWLTWDP